MKYDNNFRQTFIILKTPFPLREFLLQKIFYMKTNQLEKVV